MFCPPAAPVKDKTSRKRKKGKNHDVRRIQKQNQGGNRSSGAVARGWPQRGVDSIPKRHGQVPYLQLRQRNADRSTEAVCLERGGSTYLEFARVLRASGRERHSHPGSDDGQKKEDPRRTTVEEKGRISRRRSCTGPSNIPLVIVEVNGAPVCRDGACRCGGCKRTAFEFPCHGPDPV